MSKMKSDSELKQGTAQWHKFRSKGIGASEAPSVLSVSPWTTRFELWTYKTGLLAPPEPHVNAAKAMQRGIDNEPIARKLYIEKTGINVEPVTAIHPEHDFIRASLDGWNEEKKHIIEIKVPGLEDLKKARKGQVPEKYRWQINQQFLVTDANTCDYVVYDGKEELIIIPVERNKADEEVLLAELIAFWELVETKTPPSIDEADIDRVVSRIKKEHEKLSKSLEALFILNELLLTKKVIE